MRPAETLLNLIDKTDYPEGIWLHEPDKYQWATDNGKFVGLVIRHPQGYLQGAVGVPSGNLYYGRSVEECAQYFDSVGFKPARPLVYADFAQEPTLGAISYRISKIDPALWLLAFHCGTRYDRIPSQPETANRTYRDWSYTLTAVQELLTVAQHERTSNG